MKRNEHGIGFSTIKGFLENEKPRLQREYHIKEIGIFGSYVCGEQRKASDIDILVSFDGCIGGFQYITLMQELSEKLGRKISSKEHLKPGIGKKIEREVIFI